MTVHKSEVSVGPVDQIKGTGFRVELRVIEEWEGAAAAIPPGPFIEIAGDSQLSTGWYDEGGLTVVIKQGLPIDGVYLLPLVKIRDLTEDD